MSKKDPYADERLVHIIEHAARHGQNIVLTPGTDEVRLEPEDPPAPAFEPKWKGWVYVVQVRGFDLVKIGYSTDPERRRVELGSGSGMGEGMVLLAQFPGDGYVERKLHRQFAEQRLYGEWFRLEGDLAAWVDTKRPAVAA